MTLGEIRKRKSFVSSWKHCAVVVLVFLPAACARPSTPQINPVLQDETLAALPEVPALPPKKPLDRPASDSTNRLGPVMPSASRTKKAPAYAMVNARTATRTGNTYLVIDPDAAGLVPSE